MRCPHCQKRIYMTLTACEDDVVEVTQKHNGTKPAMNRDEAWEATLTSGQRAMLKSVEEDGTIDLMLVALADSPNALSMPTTATGKHRFFISFMKSCAEKRIPEHALRYFARKYNGAHIKVLGANGILAIVVDGKLGGFVPQQIVMGSTAKTATGKAWVLESTPEELDVWVRTRFGYAAGGGLFLNEMKKRSKGEFALPKFERA